MISSETKHFHQNKPTEFLEGYSILMILPLPPNGRTFMLNPCVQEVYDLKKAEGDMLGLWPKLQSKLVLVHLSQ